MKTKVYQLISNTSSNPVANQFIIETPKGDYFQSYESIIAFKSNKGKIKLDNRYWDYSKTTSKYRNQFTGLTTKETEKAIKSKEIQLTNLN
tara:strand:+ start:448 stop:720 length:273 start_codon:yes stop_codon:yes gene_type:complete